MADFSLNHQLAREIKFEGKAKGGIATNLKIETFSLSHCESVGGELGCIASLSYVRIMEECENAIAGFRRERGRFIEKGEGFTVERKRWKDTKEKESVTLRW